MTLVQLRYFVAIADAGFNITSAAEHVHATQPGLSKQLKQLEDELGFLLFVRKGRSLEELTRPAPRCSPHARKILLEASNIRAFAANQRRDGHGQLLIATTHTQARFVLPPVISAGSPGLSAPEHPPAAQRRWRRAVAAGAWRGRSGPHQHGRRRARRWRGHPRVPLAPRGADAALASAGAERGAADPGRSRRVSAGELRILDPPRLLAASRFATRGLEHAAGDDRARCRPDQDLRRAGIGVGLLAEMAVSAIQDSDLVAFPAPDAIPECTAWAVLPRERVLRDYTVELLVSLAPQLDRHDLRRILAGNQAATWPAPPTWTDLSQVITS